MPEDFDRGEYRTPEELAPIWDVRPDTVRSWVRQRLIPAVRIGRRLYIHRDVRRPHIERIEPKR